MNGELCELQAQVACVFPKPTGGRPEAGALKESLLFGVHDGDVILGSDFCAALRDEDLGT